MEYVIYFFLIWIGIYCLSRNIGSRVALLVAIFSTCLALYYAGDFSTRSIMDYRINMNIWRFTSGTYLIPIAILFHFSVLTTQIFNKSNKYILTFLYILTGALYITAITTNLYINNSVSLGYIEGVGYINPRGPLFWLTAVAIIISSLAAIKNYLFAIKRDGKNIKYLLATAASILYLIIGPFIVFKYYDLANPYTIATLTPFLLTLPFVLFIIAIFYGLISDVENIFNAKEFLYQTIVTVFIVVVTVGILYPAIEATGEYTKFYIYVLIILTILTHSFYDWLSTFIRDLLYNAGKGFSLITDSDVNDVIKNFHNSEKLETSPLTRFAAVRKQNRQLATDGVQSLVTEAIEYFKQPDYPRRTRQNIKYQILKMLTHDQADEGQILWELGFEGYPMKIMSGEDATRKPLFKIESMSDYTAVSRNAFISLKKEAIHDLAWRLSAIERG